jgi:hypothetical protein
MACKFICVSGYGKSGSGACVNLLKEFEYIDGLDREFRIVKDPYGLIDLEHSLVNNWDFVRHNTAINDFLNYCRMLARDDGLFKEEGKNFSKLLNIDFVKETERYIDSLVDFKYHGETLLHNYNLKAKDLFYKKIRSKLKMGNELPMYFARPSESEFLLQTTSYIDNLFSNYSANNNIKMVVLNQAISPGNISNAIKYFNSMKLIIIDRDPRDIYATMLKERRLLGGELSHSNVLDKYLIWHNAVRVRSEIDIANSNLEKNILRIQFEDFFTDYNKVLEKIKNFIGIDFIHKNKGSRFSPEKINEYVGIWRDLQDQSAISRISEELIK